MLLQFGFDIEILVLLDKDDNFKILRDFNVRFRYEKNILIKSKHKIWRKQIL